MSTLDKAFIKAFEKDAASFHHSATRSPSTTAEPRSPGAAHTPPPPAGTSYEHAPVHRADVAHETGSQLHAPHVSFPSPGAYTELAYVNPQPGPLPQGISTALEGQQVVPPAPTASAPSVSDPASRPVDAAMQPVPPPMSEVVTAQPPGTGLQPLVTDAWATPLATDEAKDALRTAASIKLPQPLGLPSAFEALADEAQKRLDAETFAPQWEVDRFVWPDVCHRLLDVERAYFQHVGERLKEATENGRHVLMITGARRGEGRTTLALCLARCAAEAGVGVALVDADLTNPQLGRCLGMETPCSWLDVIVDKAPLSEAAIASIEDRLTLFPLASTEYVDIPDKRLIALLRNISKHYPLVIVDTGPMPDGDRSPLGDSREESNPIDAAIVVRDLRHTPADQTRATAERLQQSGILAVGIAENFKTS